MFIDLFSGGSSFLIVQQVEQSLSPPRRNRRARKGRAGLGCMWRSSTTGVLCLLDAKISQFCDAPHFRLHRHIILQWEITGAASSALLPALPTYACGPPGALLLQTEASSLHPPSTVPTGSPFVPSSPS
jgi:hypothetical protein